MQNNYSQSKKICISALFLAMALIASRFKIIIPGVMSIVFTGPFYKFIAIIFGPYYGATIAVLLDIILAVVDSGSYVFLFSLTAFLRAFLIGTLWKYLYKNTHAKKKIYLDLIYAIAMPDLLISFFNSLILKSYFLWPEKTFLVNLYIRFLKESILIIINVFILYNMLEIYKKMS